jgi:uncharacterized protein RhaS with RHS repeats
MKTKWITLLILVLLAFPAGSNAWASRDPLGGGTWIDRDPIGERASFNLYSYVDNDPINLIDPFGLKPGDPYPSANAAAIQALEDINVTSDVQHVEYAGRVTEIRMGRIPTRPQRP